MSVEIYAVVEIKRVATRKFRNVVLAVFVSYIDMTSRIKTMLYCARKARIYIFNTEQTSS
jgi:hypothetical protein